jgi:hypothetical protein
VQFNRADLSGVLSRVREEVVKSPLTVPAAPSTAPMSTGTEGKRAARGLSGASAPAPLSALRIQ